MHSNTLRCSTKGFCWFQALIGVFFGTALIGYLLRAFSQKVLGKPLSISILWAIFISVLFVHSDTPFFLLLSLSIVRAISIIVLCIRLDTLFCCGAYPIVNWCSTSLSSQNLLNTLKVDSFPWSFLIVFKRWLLKCIEDFWFFS